MKENLQKIFNVISNHLLTQNQRCVGNDGLCKYRSENGLKCAAGILKN